MVQCKIVVNQFTAAYLIEFTAEPRWCNRPLNIQITERKEQITQFYQDSIYTAQIADYSNSPDKQSSTSTIYMNSKDKRHTEMLRQQLIDEG